MRLEVDKDLIVKVEEITKVHLSEPSIMKEVNEGIDLLYEWSGFRTMNLKLLYRGSRDGTTLPKVHSKINGKRPTFMFIKNHHGLVFGLFTSIHWATPPRDDTHYHD